MIKNLMNQVLKQGGKAGTGLPLTPDEIMKMASKHMKITIGCSAIGCLLPMIVLIGLVVIIIGGVMSPFEGITNYAGNSARGQKQTDNWVEYGEIDEEKNSFYKKIKELSDDYQEDGIAIDTALVASIVFYRQSPDPSKDYSCKESVDEEGNKGDCEKEENNSESVDYYKQAKKVMKGMVSDGSLKSDDEIKEWLRDHFMEDKMKEVGFEFSKDSKTKKQQIDDAIDEVFSKRDAYASFTYKEENASEASAFCTFKLGNKEISDGVRVQLLTCDGSKVIEEMTLDKYIKGVVYAEVRGSAESVGSSKAAAEVVKAQALVARSFTLKRQEHMCPGRPNDCEFGYNPKKNIIRMRSCEADNAYCDYEKGCSRNTDDRGGIATWVQGGSNPERKMSAKKQKEFAKVMDSVAGQVVLDKNGIVYYTNYTSTEQNKFSQYAKEGDGYAKIINRVYGSDKKVSSSCGAGLSGLKIIPGAYSKPLIYYNQNDYRNYPLGNVPGANIATHGCGPTSMAIAVSTMLQQKHDPIETTKYACQSSGVCNYYGTREDVWQILGKKYGLKSVEEYGGTTSGSLRKPNMLEIQKALYKLSTGKAMLGLWMSSGPFSYGVNHYILLTGITEDRKVIVVDPASTERTGKAYSADQTINIAQAIWVLEEP